VDEDRALNEFFEENGFTTKILIKNLGSTFVYLIIYILIFMMLPLLKILAKNSKGMLIIYEWLRKNLFWNGVIAFILS
jgi:hypothetical protein